VRIFENGMLSKFGAERGEVTGEWRGLDDEQLCAVLFTRWYVGYQVKDKMGWAGGMYGEEGSECGILVGNPKERRSDLSSSAQMSCCCHCRGSNNPILFFLECFDLVVGAR
jgi:hypothetical protein